MHAWAGTGVRMHAATPQAKGAVLHALASEHPPMKRILVTLSLAALLGAVAIPGATVAHGGNGCGLSGPSSAPILEGECYSSPVPCNEIGCTFACDPDPDGEHTHVEALAGASGGSAAFSPHAQCGFIFGSVSFGAPLPLVAYTYKITGARFQCSGSAQSTEYLFHVYVDFKFYGSSDFWCAGGSGLKDQGISEYYYYSHGAGIGPGSHRIDFYFDSGGWTNNLELDDLQLSCTGTLVVNVGC